MKNNTQEDEQLMDVPPGASLIGYAVKLRRSGRRYQALTPSGSIWGFLLLDVLLDDRQWGSSSRPGKITGGPEAIAP